MDRKSATRFVCLMAVCGLPAFCAAADPEPQAPPAVYRTLGKAGNGYALAFSPDDRLLLAAREYVGPGDVNDQLIEWDVEKGAVRRRFDPGHGGQVCSIAYSKSGRYLAVGHLDGYVSVREGKGDVVLSFMSVEDTMEKLVHMSLTEDGDEASVHTVVDHGIAQTRSIPDGRTQIFYIGADNYSINSAAMPRNGTTLVYCTPQFMKAAEGGRFSQGHELKSYSVFKKPVTIETAVSDDAATAMTVTYSGELALFDLKADRLIKRWRGHDDLPIYAVMPFHGRDWFATGNDTGEVRVWDEKGDLRATLKAKGQDGPVTALALTNDNRFLATSCENRPVIIWDLKTVIGDNK